MSDRVVEEEDGDPGGEKGNQVGDEEGPTATLIRDSREPSDVP